MGVNILPFPSSKTRFIVTLTSGTSYTVPAGVNYLNVTLYGGGGGSGGVDTSATGTATAGGTGGSTTFTGATTALGGTGGTERNAGVGGASTIRNIATAPIANTSLGATSATRSVSAVPYHQYAAQDGRMGQCITSNLTVTPGASISYSIGAGGTAGGAGGGVGGAAGGSGRIVVEYWL